MSFKCSVLYKAIPNQVNFGRNTLIRFCNPVNWTSRLLLKTKMYTHQPSMERRSISYTNLTTLMLLVKMNVLLQSHILSLEEDNSYTIRESLHSLILVKSTILMVLTDIMISCHNHIGKCYKPTHWILHPTLHSIPLSKPLSPLPKELSIKYSDAMVY